MADLNIPDSILEEFRCSVCKGYLSSAPVQLLPDGKSICTTCATLTEQPTHRQLTLESLLSKLFFPCRFNEYGCKERVPFGQTAEHEDKCSFQPYSCPCLPVGSCTWKGSTTQIYEHFNKQHWSLIQQKLEFKLQVDKDEEGILMTCEGVPLIMKYKYNNSTSSLHHDVRLIALNMQEGLYKIQLINDLDHDYSITMKGGTFLPYDNQFYGTEGTGQDWKVLVVNNFLQNLNNPSCIVVTINANVSKLTVESNEQLPLTVDYKLIRTLTCIKCSGYLIPPLFRIERGGIVCFYCHDSYGYTQPSYNYKLNERAEKTNFPCRWRGCDVIGKSNNIREHQLICQVRIFNCRDCESTFLWEGAMFHIQSHRYKYVIDKYVYKMKCKNGLVKKMFAIKNNEIVYINHELKYLANEYNHQLEMFLTGSYSSKITAEVRFEHVHCKNESKPFYITKTTSFGLNEFPPCFKHTDELTVTVKI